MANSPILELLLRNTEIFDGKDVVVAGDIYDPMVLKALTHAKSALVILDNFVTAQKMAALVGQSFDHTYPQCIEYKHVKLAFCDAKTARTYLNEKIDVLALLLSKNKQHTQNLLSLFADSIKMGGFIYTAGANDAGGKSADTLLKAAGDVRKLDLARKCTLFKATVEKDFKKEIKSQSISVNAMGHNIELLQDPSVFSCGKFDLGTKMLLEAMENIVPFGSALDLGCGCGVVGISLLKHGYKEVTFADVSASALTLTKENLNLNNESKGTRLVAADMLDGLDKYSLIAVNPPFHIGVATTTAPAVNMIMHAKEHLTEDGVFYMVANSHLGYDEVLLENFAKVSIVKSSTTFIVYRATLK